MFKEWIGDIPGSASSVFPVADTVHTAASAVDAPTSSIRSSENDIPSWSGYSRNAYSAVLNGQCDDLSTLQSGLEQGAKALEQYAWALSSYQSRADDLRAQAEELDKKLDKASLVEKIGMYFSLLAPARAIWNDYRHYVAKAKNDGEVCAASLYEALHIEALNYDTNHNNIGGRTPLTDAMRSNIDADLATLDYTNVNQRGIGDCYFLATFMAMTRTEKGREWIRQQIRWDDQAGGYLVTIYDDPLHPREDEKRVVLVKDVYQYGVQGSYDITGKDPRRASVAAIFESAYGQIHPGGTLSSSESPAGIGGGWLSGAWSDLTGKNDATSISSRGFLGLGEGYSTGERQQIQQYLKDGRAICAETASSASTHFDKQGVAQAQVETSRGSQTIEVVKSHEYMVISASDEGVTLRNPWGRNNLSSGGSTDGTFTISWDDFGKYYGSVEIGGPY